VRAIIWWSKSIELKKNKKIEKMIEKVKELMKNELY